MSSNFYKNLKFCLNVIVSNISVADNNFKLMDKFGGADAKFSPDRVFFLEGISLH